MNYESRRRGQFAQFQRPSYPLSQVDDGVTAVLAFVSVRARSQEEAAAWKQLLSESEESLILQEEPFCGRIMIPRFGHDEQSLDFPVMTVEAADLLFYRQFTEPPRFPLADSGRYVVSGGESNGIPMITILSRDRRRALCIASEKETVIAAVNDYIFRKEGVPLDPPVFKSFCRYSAGHFARLCERAEHLFVNVRTAEQVIKALTKYRGYLDPLADLPEPSDEGKSSLPNRVRGKDS